MAFDRAKGEDQLALADMQGDVLIGLQKDYQQFIGFTIQDVPLFKAFVRGLVPQITSAKRTLEREFQLQMQKTLGTKTRFDFVGINLSFTFGGLQHLNSAAADQIEDAAFKEGLSASRSAALGDPTTGPGSPETWKIGGSKEINGLLIVTGPGRTTVLKRVNEIKAAAGTAWTIIHEEAGRTRALDRGHEHFGFLDGVSQPAVRGQIDQTFPGHTFLNESQNPRDPGQGLPGADLHWPGEFVFGYPAQDPTNIDNRGAVAGGGAPWMKNGSLMVFRRLQQLVPEFDAFVDDQANLLNMDPVLLGARMVGRWKSGSPISLSPIQDNPVQGADPMSNNDFEFGDDVAARRCPYAAHIRKSYPRNDITPAATGATDFARRDSSEADTQTHRVMRRGIPFGDEVSDEEASSNKTAGGVAGDRGLMFVCYQTSIERQFEFIIKNWVNDLNFAVAGAGHDPVLGQTSANSRKRSFVGATVNYPNGNAGPSIDIPADFVVPTGGAYLFVPSLSAIQDILT